jgi:hypothetical protein
LCQQVLLHELETCMTVHDGVASCSCALLYCRGSAQMQAAEASAHCMTLHSQSILARAWFFVPGADMAYATMHDAHSRYVTGRCIYGQMSARSSGQARWCDDSDNEACHSCVLTSTHPSPALPTWLLPALGAEADAVTGTYKAKFPNPFLKIDWRQLRESNEACMHGDCSWFGCSVRSTLEQR